jgi:outer membrane protein
MKRNKLFTIVAAFATALTFTQCAKEAQPAQTAANNTVVTEAAQSGLKIAYVDIDSLLSNYKLSVKLNNDMLRKTENAQLTLGEKAKSIQADMADFQKKLENNVFATRERAESEQARIVKRQEEYARLEQRLAGELAAEEQKNSIALRDSINNFMKEYNATHGYDIILSRIGENILFANEALDITKEVIDGLNKCYNEAE